MTFFAIIFIVLYISYFNTTQEYDACQYKRLTMAEMLRWDIEIFCLCSPGHSDLMWHVYSLEKSPRWLQRDPYRWWFNFCLKAQIGFSRPFLSIFALLYSRDWTQGQCSTTDLYSQPKSTCSITTPGSNPCVLTGYIRNVLIYPLARHASKPSCRKHS